MYGVEIEIICSIQIISEIFVLFVRHIGKTFSLTMSGHNELFQTLYGSDEGGLEKMPNQNVYTCRICQMTPSNSGLRTETDWIQHLLTDSHQNIHRSHQLLRKVLWDLDRTVAITNVMGM